MSKVEKLRESHFHCILSQASILPKARLSTLRMFKGLSWPLKLRKRGRNSERSSAHVTSTQQFEYLLNSFKLAWQKTQQSSGFHSAVEIFTELSEL